MYRELRLRGVGSESAHRLKVAEKRKSKMNKQDSDAIDLLEIATHLSYFGYQVMPVESDGEWYAARGNATWSFEFARWQAFLCLRRSRTFRKSRDTDFGKYHDLVNRVRRISAVTQLVLSEDDAENFTVHSWAMIPATYDRRSFSRNFMDWTRDADRLQEVISMGSGD